MMEEEEGGDQQNERRPLRTKDDALNPENVKAEKLRSKDVLDDVLNAVRFCCVRFLNKRSTNLRRRGKTKTFGCTFEFFFPILVRVDTTTSFVKREREMLRWWRATTTTTTTRN